MAQSIDDARRRHQGAAVARVPPHNLQAEESLLGAMLLSRDAIVAAVEVQLSADDFYKPAHGHVFDAVTSLYASGEPADPVTVAESLRRAGVLEAIGGPATLITLQAGTPAIGNAGRYARIVEEHSLLRRLIRVAGDIAELGYGVPEDVAGAVDEAEAMVFDVAQRRVTDSMATIRDLLSAQLDHLEALYERNQEITGVPTGFIDLDRQLAGLQPSNLVIVGGRPGTGKTSFSLGIAAHAALEAHTPVLVFSLEMSHRELTQRLLCSEARVDATRMRNGKLLESDWPKISHAVGRLGEAQIFIDDNPHLTIMEIRAKARRLKSREGLGLIVIDYLQLMSGRSNAENRQVEVSEMSRGLKILARELNVPVIALSQLSRNLESRADKRPVLADLRESGCMPASTRILRADNGEDVSLGELVLSQEQPLVWSVDEHQRLVPAPLVKAFPSGIKPVFRLQFASGRSVDATANHKFLTVDGWVRLDGLPIGSFVAVPSRIPAPARPGGRWPDDDLALLAHMPGDGSMGTGFKYGTSELDGIEENPNLALMPRPVTQRVNYAARTIGASHRDSAAGLGGTYCGSYLRTEDRPRRFSRDRLAAMASVVGSSQLPDMAMSDLYWDEIVAVTPQGMQPTFDATVAETHNFIADGVVAHNSLEQDADVVIFLYRDEVYNRDTPDRGTAEVIVAKHRNGPIGVTHLAFLDHYTRFANMARV
jgi:replicative DNA helicase